MNSNSDKGYIELSSGNDLKIRIVVRCTDHEQRLLLFVVSHGKTRSRARII